MRYLIPSIIVITLLVAPARSAFAESPADQIPALIRQLGDDAPKVRDEAGLKLRRMGKAAVPELTKALDDPDLEISCRAQLLLKQIREDAEPRLDPRPTWRGAPIDGRIRLRTNLRGGAFRSVSVMRAPDGSVVRETTVGENGQTTVLREDASGLTLTTTDRTGDKEKTDVVKAKDAETLKKENPDAYARYERLNKQAAVVPRGGDAGGAFDPLDPETRQRMRQALEEAGRQMDEAKARTAEEGKRRLDEMRKLRRQLEERQENEGGAKP